MKTHDEKLVKILLQEIQGCGHRSRKENLRKKRKNVWKLLIFVILNKIKILKTNSFKLTALLTVSIIATYVLIRYRYFFYILKSKVTQQFCKTGSGSALRKAA